MDLIETLRDKARKNPKRIVLPEGEEPRTVKAAAIITREKLAHVTLIGNRAKIEAAAKDQGVDVGAVPSIDRPNCRYVAAVSRRLGSASARGR